MSIIVTEACAEYNRQSLTKRQKGQGIKIGVKTSGCSGLAYMLEYVDEKDDCCQEFKFDGFSVFVDPKHLPYLEGMTVDYESTQLQSGIKFINPHETSVCGCGKSFNV